MNPDTFFSVIVTTRNRSDLLSRALESIAKQKPCGTFNHEIVLVDDGSSVEHKEINLSLLTRLNLKTSYKYLEYSRQGHGPSHARNRGAQLAQGEYLCFLDDDDYWTDDTLLATAHSHLFAKNNRSLFLSNQDAVLNETEIVDKSIWIEDLKILFPELEVPFIGNVDKEKLLSSNSFAHLNCTIISKVFFEQLDGFDEAIRYEEDRDFYYRAIDQAETVIYNSHNVSRHVIPNNKNKTNASTSLEKVSKLNMQIYSMSKIASSATHKKLTKLCNKRQSYLTYELAYLLINEKRARSIVLALKGFQLSPSLSLVKYCYDFCLSFFRQAK